MRRRLEEDGGVELVPPVGIVGAEHQRHAGAGDERADLAIEGRAVLALGCAEGGRIDRLGPHEEVEVGPPERLGREGEMCVDDRPDCVEGADLGAQSIVVADVGLHHSHRDVVGVPAPRGELRGPPGTVEDERQDERRDGGRRRACPADPDARRTAGHCGPRRRQ